MPRIKLKIEYDGTKYVGWQAQTNGVSIQGEIEDSLKKIFNQKILKKKNFVFEYCTSSKAKALRGFHFQYNFQQAKYVNVLKGKILDCVIDLRKNSRTFGKTFKIILSDKNCLSLYIPEGFAHGFCSLTNNTILHYRNSNYRDKRYEIGILWKDKDLNIKWPIKNPLISLRDKKNLTFSKFLDSKNFKKM